MSIQRSGLYRWFQNPLPNESASRPSVVLVSATGFSTGFREYGVLAEERFGRTAAMVVVTMMAAALPVAVRAGEVPRAAEDAAARGYRFVTTTPLLPADFDQEVFDRLWTTWPKPLRERARDASPEERRKMAFERYGLVESPEHPGADPRWAMSTVETVVG